VAVTSGPCALRVVELTKRYGDRVALDAVSVDVAAGEVFALLGPNGAGKSTFVSVVAGLRRADHGVVIVDGVDALAHRGVARSRVGLAPQETALYEVLTVRENLRFFAELVGLRRRARDARIDEVGEALRLRALMDRVVGRLSGGERRRVHTAIAFLHRPPLLLLDEPTVGADVETRVALLEVVRAAADDGAAVLYSTHYLPEVEALGASVAILVAGRVIASGAVDELVGAYGQVALELTFDGPVPAVLAMPRDDDGVVRVVTPRPAAELASIVGRLGSHADRLRAVEVVRPSLDSVFISLTGRRYCSDDGDVPAA
jgi:ABC-2 type transport system ATP-binding protein